MTLKELIDALELCPAIISDDTVDVTGAYCGDLLSDVLANLDEGAAWMTVQGHANIVAVAQLRDPSCVILVNRVHPEPDTIAKAKTHGINILCSPRTSADLCMKLADLLK